MISLYPEYMYKTRLHWINIYLATPSFNHLTFDEKMNFEEKLSYVGGTQGLFNGCCLMTFVEVLFFVLKFLVTKLRMFKYARKVSKVSTENTEVGNKNKAEGWREYLETASIIGLSYFTSKSVLIKCFWIFIVFLSFCISGFFIVLESQDWHYDPISTVVDTLPIKKLTKFPSVTVCPPKDSHTGLNYDLVRADNITLGENDREDIATKASELVLLENSEEIISMLALFGEKDFHKNWYEGFTKVSFLQKYESRWIYFYSTSLTSGIFSTPIMYGEFQKTSYVTLEFLLLLDQNISTLHANNHFVIELNITMFQTDSTIEKIIFGFYDYSALEILQFHGTREIRKKYIVNDFQIHHGLGTVYYIQWTREKGTNAVLDTNHQIGHFRLKWHFEDENGKNLDVSPKPFYSTTFDFDGMNQIYRNWINSLNSEITGKATTIEKMWRKIHHLQYSSGRERKNLICGKTFLMELLNDMSEHKYPRGENAINDEVLAQGFKMFVHILSCPASHQTELIWFYDDLFRSESTRTILQNLIQIKRNHPELKYLNILISLLNKKLDLSYGKIYLALSSLGSNMDSIDGVFFTSSMLNIRKCFNKGHCDDVLEYLASVGMLVLFFI